MVDDELSVPTVSAQKCLEVKLNITVVRKVIYFLGGFN